MTLKATARFALSAVAVGLVGITACSDRDDAPPFVIGAQWFDANEGEGAVSALDSPAPQDVINTSGTALEFGASVSLSPNVTGIQILFSEPLNADVIEDLDINETEPVDLEAGILNRKSKYNPGVIAFTGRTGLVELVDVATGKTYEAVAEYLTNSRAEESIVFSDVGMSITPVDILPTNTEFQIRVFAGEIKDRDGNVLRAAERKEVPAAGGRPFVVGDVTDASGRSIAAVIIFATDGLAVASVTGPALPTDADGAVTSLVTEDDPDTFENETAVVVEFSTDVVTEDAATDSLSIRAGTSGAFTLYAAGDAATPIPFTVEPLITGSTVDDDGNPDPDAEAEPVLSSVQIIPTVALAAGDYELRIDPTFEDTYGNATAADVQIVQFSVE